MTLTTLLWCSQGSTEWNPANQFWKYRHAPAALEQQHFARELIRTRDGFHASAYEYLDSGAHRSGFCYEQTKMVCTHDTTSLMYVVFDAETSIP